MLEISSSLEERTDQDLRHCFFQEAVAGAFNAMKTPTQLLVAIGQILLKERHSTDWLNVEEISKICRENGIVLNSRIPTSHELETCLWPLFQAQEEIWENGVNVVGWDRRIGWDLVFCVRFHKYNPEHLGFVSSPAEEALTVCAD